MRDSTSPAHSRPAAQTDAQREHSSEREKRTQPATAKDVTFVCCVEYGHFAEQFVRLVESIRRWGVAFAERPILAIAPRATPPLPKDLQRALATHGVTYIRRPRLRKHGWYPYLTKPAALQIAEEVAETGVIAFLDNDIIIAREPVALALPADVDLVAAPASAHGGSSGPGHEHEPLWQAMTDAVGVDLETLPWITTDLDHQRVRLYLSAGVFAYRRGAGDFARIYEDSIRRILDRRICCAHWGTQLLEQAAFGFAIIRAGRRWQTLDDSHNYHFGPGLDRYYKPDRIRAARILHYHGAMKPDYMPRFLETIREPHPEVAAWLSELGPISYHKHVRRPADVYHAFLKATRRARREWYERVASKKY